jgi:hypothetical protein
MRDNAVSAGFKKRLSFLAVSLAAKSLEAQAVRLALAMGEVVQAGRDGFLMRKSSSDLSLIVVL